MLSRTKSIFHLEEEEEQQQEQGDDQAIREVQEGLVGLRILIQHQGRKVPKNIVIKPTKFSTDLGFLKACFFCKKELSLQKDVYIGDQGFCSVECRYKQMVVDEKIEFEEATKERLKMAKSHHHHHHHHNHHHHHHHHVHHGIAKMRESADGRRRRRVLASAAC
ncbi:FCS-Like Zinc finger 5-like isoform X2 [Dioscorea cayenensis subsp. rotundata]|uniref:FCS-Like Zinc finger 5-like isoform X2 n=1 Tax=Dioscorea cayennensis subsp. rotundata TaxID=55577 RepID=A0AB40D2X2_DIOCR|nr:FCS-Like Zinc finger 5-like isoform X2 [Dioscorea cayenensis subsp. rotundata]